MTDVRTHMFVANADSLAIFPRVQPPRELQDHAHNPKFIEHETHHHESISKPAILESTMLSLRV
jgi:hypothetical protein